MNSAKPQPENTGELGPPNPGIFPLHPDTVQSEFRDLFAMSSDKVLDLIRTARSSGPTDELFPYIVRNHVFDWEHWHLAEKDFSDSGITRLLYEVGLLYGVDMAQSVSRQQRVAGDLRAENPHALDSAARYLYQTYRGLPDSEEMPGWQRQKLRELRYTGSDILTIANATLNDKIRAMISQYAMETEDGTELESLSGEAPNITDDDTQSLLVGLVDGAIFIEAYERFSKGDEPKPFDEPVEYFPAYNPRRHIRGLSEADWALSLAPFEMESTDHLSQLGADETSESVTETLYESIYHYADVTGKRRLVQVGPNDFRLLTEIEKLKPKAFLLKKHLLAIGGSALLADGAWVALEVAEGKRPGVADMLFQTVLGLGAIAAFGEVRRRRSSRVFEALYDQPNKL